MNADPKIDAGNWEQLQALFHLIDDAPEPERERILNANCSDPDLRRRVWELVGASEVSNSTTSETISAPEGIVSGTIGPYTILRRIGYGGAGTVYLVEREMSGVKQRAALKVLAPHAVGPAFADRLQKEQRILASLDHPNVTRMLDAGIDSGGQPYLVMEYVEGQHLDAYCDDRRLGIAERLAVFAKICEAVDYAHRNLIVHLDLKPSNILVTSDGIPKLLDFGTSKLLSADGQSTTTLPVTPSYASPEQLRNDAVTTACDVYSLGVILYELLAGRRPTGNASMAAIIESALEEREPAPLTETITVEAADKRGMTEGRLRSVLAGDLSAIVRKCLEVRARDRYPSVSALSEDIERYVDGRPVQAQRQTTLYHVRKFVRRNWLPATAAAIFAIGLATAAGIAIYQARAARAQAAKAEAVTQFLADVFYSGEPDDVKDRTVLQAMEIARGRLGELSNEPDVEVRLRAALGFIYAANSRLPEAIEELKRAEALSRQTGNYEMLASTLLSMSNVMSDAEDSRRSYREALSIAETKPDRLSMKLRVSILSEVGQDLGIEEGHSPHVEHVLREAVRLGRANPVPTNTLAMAMSRLGQYLRYENRFDEAQPILLEALALLATHPTVNSHLALEQLGAIQIARGDLQGGERYYHERRDLLMRLQGPGNGTTMDARSRWAGLLARLGHTPEALREMKDNLEFSRKAFLPGTLGLWHPLSTEAYILNLADQPAEALRFARESLDCLGPTNKTDLRAGQIKTELGIALVKLHRYVEAMPYLQYGERVDLANPSAGPKSYATLRVQEFLKQARGQEARVR